MAERLARYGRAVSASDSGSGGRGFDSQPSHAVIALGKQFTLIIIIIIIVVNIIYSPFALCNYS